MLPTRHAQAAAGGALAAMLIAGCAVGPDYKRPPPLGTNAMPAAFAGINSTNQTAWKRAEPSAHLPRGAWWELIGDSDLNRLESLAGEGNQELAATFARFEQARALVTVSRADLFPQLTATPSVDRQRTSKHIPPGRGATFNTFTVPLDAAWEADLWGRVRRGVEGTRARLAAAADDVESARLAIRAEIAIDYSALRSFDAQVALLQETIKTYERSLQLTQNRHNSGIASELDVAQAETQLRSAEAELPALELQRANVLHALATLCGRPAATFAIPPSPSAVNAAVPAIPLSLPSELLEHRPDIAAAERRVAAANADIGVAAAAFYPRITLGARAGLQSIDAGTLFQWPSRVWSLGPAVEWPVFTGGRNRAGLASARAAYDAVVASYRQTVLSAFQDVEDQLAAQRLLSEQLQAEEAALKSARRTLEISSTRYKGGVITYLEVAIAQSAALAHEQTVVQLTARRLAAAVSLIKALGAGWNADTAAAGTNAPGLRAATPDAQGSVRP